MTRPAIEVADIVRARGRQFLQRFKAILSYQQLKAFELSSVAVPRLSVDIRTGVSAALTRRPSPSTPADHELSQVPGQARRRWLEAQQRDLLNTNYFHVVFTVPHELNRCTDFTQAIARSAIRGQLPESARGGCRSPAAGRRDRFLSILHTWSSNLLPITISTRSSRRRTVG